MYEPMNEPSKVVLCLGYLSQIIHNMLASLSLYQVKYINAGALAGRGHQEARRDSRAHKLERKHTGVSLANDGERHWRLQR